MFKNYTSEGVLRVFVIGTAVLLLSVWGCQSWQESSSFPPMEATTITVEPDMNRPKTFIEALRESCMTYGSFILEYQGEQENYECRRVE